ncbi:MULTISPECIES: hypothetical protein [Escherichia]|uniref:hypothetical protein n=1 Tax=Escherichia TaxID=561 RepID=UPI001F36A7A5|nr:MULTISPECIES: hypothetical protein [Escherichia]
MSNKDFSLFILQPLIGLTSSTNTIFMLLKPESVYFRSLAILILKLKPGRENKITMRPPVSVLTPIMTTKGLSVNRLMMKEFHIGLLSVI